MHPQDTRPPRPCSRCGAPIYPVQRPGRGEWRYARQCTDCHANGRIATQCPTCNSPLSLKRTEVARGRRYCSRRCFCVALESRPEPTTPDGFWARVDRNGPIGCWLWMGHRQRLGYGRVHYNRRRYLAHRLAWILTRGPIPAGMFLCHSCDNPPCVNPSHMFIGTTTDNMRDMARKGRTGGRAAGRRHAGSSG